MTDRVANLYKNAGFKLDYTNVNKYVKAVIINFGDERGDIVVENDNFGKRRKYPDFTEGRKKAGLHPMQIVLGDIELAKITHQKYIGRDDQVYVFGEEDN